MITYNGQWPKENQHLFRGLYLKLLSCKLLKSNDNIVVFYINLESGMPDISSIIIYNSALPTPHFSKESLRKISVYLLNEWIADTANYRIIVKFTNNDYIVYSMPNNWSFRPSCDQTNQTNQTNKKIEKRLTVDISLMVPV